ncbi:MAG: RNA 3'-terminal phosphate cyclase [Chloroflexota bacterium]
MLMINGAYGEGGGQILRTALTLATLLTQPICIENIRANRANPGLAAQHLTAVKAAAMICEARLSGDKLGSTRLSFEPQSRPIAGIYEFDVAEARPGGSAGAATLVLQTVLLPLALAGQSSIVTVQGGTHVPWSPPFHYLRDVYLPILAQLGVTTSAELRAWGWFPAGAGEIQITIGGADARPDRPARPLAGIGPERGALKHISGVAVASSLPAHIAQRMRDRAVNLLKQAGLPAGIEPQRVSSVSPGAGIFLAAGYEAGLAGFSALGKKGKPADQVAAEAVDDLLAFHRCGAGVDRHLADQVILPLALTDFSGPLHVEALTQHTLTNIWVVEQFLGKIITVDHDHNLIFFAPRDRAWL